MARKAKVEPPPTCRDGDWESNGMYRWYIGPRQTPKSKAESKERFDEQRNYLRQPWAERLNELRAWLTNIIEPFWEGPLDENEFWQEREEGSAGWGHRIPQDGPMRWRRKTEDVGEIVIAHASTGHGAYRMVGGAPTGGYIRDAVSTLVGLSLLEDALSEGTDLNKITRLAIEVGEDVANISLQAAFAPIVLVGRRAIVDRPKKMHHARKVQAQEQAKDNRQQAVEAIAIMQRRFPETKKLTLLKRRAAKHLRVSPATLNRWLRPK